MAEWQTITQAAGYLGVDRSTIRQMIRDGRLVGYGQPLDLRTTALKTADLDSLKQRRRIEDNNAAANHPR